MEKGIKDSRGSGQKGAPFDVLHPVKKSWLQVYNGTTSIIYISLV